MERCLQHFKKIKINVTEPKQALKMTSPLCPRGGGSFSTEKQAHDRYLQESMLNPKSRKSMIRVSVPVADPRSAS